MPYIFAMMCIYYIRKCTLLF